jgi:hypothetical protein
MKLDDLGDKLFASTTETAAILDGLDPRTVRRAIAAGEIPGRRVGSKLLVPVAWLREQVIGTAPEAPPPTIDFDQLADRVADRVFTRLAQAFSAQAPEVDGAGPASPGPAPTVDDPLPARERSLGQGNTAA